MFIPRRLAKLNPRHRMRKAALMIQGAERKLRAGNPGPADPSNRQNAADLLALMEFLSSDGELPAPVRAAAGKALVSASPVSEDGRREGLERAANDLRHAILAEIGAPMADWDMIDPGSGLLDPGSRNVLPGLILYLEDIRSPFNVGTIFRTAEAFGVERILVSPRCADPLHPRSLRSSMGCVGLMPWERLDSAPGLEEAFALELGGDTIDDFAFPPRGVCVLGNEEMGVAPETVAACGLGRVSIPMSGAKASLNVAVAAGICLHAWRTAILEGGEK
jgi:RNA methyltransferase, TrmH family